MELDGEDPFDSLIPLCHVSYSQEERLRCCPFAPEPYGPRDNDATSSASPVDLEGEGTRIASTPIMIVSLPESEDDDSIAAAAGNSREDEFVTPPEEAAFSSSSEFRPAADHFGYDSGSDSGAVVQVVDLSRDTDLGFLAVEAVHRGKSDSDAIRLESEVLVTLVENTNLNRLNPVVKVAQMENFDSVPLKFGDEMSQGQNLPSETKQSKSAPSGSRRKSIDFEANRSCPEIKLAQRGNLKVDPSQLRPEVCETDLRSELEVLQRENLDQDSGANRSSLEIELTQRENLKGDPSPSKPKAPKNDSKSELEASQRENLDVEANCSSPEVQFTRNENPKVDPSQSKPEALKAKSKSELEASQREDLDSEANQSSPEVDITRRENQKVDPSQSKPEAPENDSKGTRVLTRELSLKAGLGESPVKKLKVSEQNSKKSNEESGVLGTTQIEDSFAFHGKGEIEINRSSTKRKLELSDDPITAETVQSEEELIGSEAMAVKLRRLPSSILGRVENMEELKSNTGKIIDVLNLLIGDTVEDETPNHSFLEICKGRGMVFAKMGFIDGNPELLKSL